jgi:hypothetical protein
MYDHHFSYITKLKEKPLMTSICEPKEEVLFYNTMEPSEPFIEHDKSTKKHTKFEEQPHPSMKSMIGNIYFIYVITYNLLP